MEEKPKAAPTEMDPRLKKGQGLDFWASGLLQNKLITQREYDEFIVGNNSKEAKMEERSLPQLRHFGEFGSVAEIREKIVADDSNRFIIRCRSKEGPDVQRLIDASLDEICEFAEKLPGGFDKWTVEVKEFAESVAAGTIIVAPNGRTTIETWHGPHYLSITNVPKYRADFDPEQMDRHYRWEAPEGAEDLPEMQDYAIKAVRHLFRHLKPKENEPIYVEYGVKQNGSVYFIEASDSPLLTGK
jgi:hypothetical protein